MGACQSMQNGDEEEKRKRSRAIDAKLEEDSRRLRKECKILLLGSLGPSLPDNGSAYIYTRFRRKRKIYDSKADEDHSPEWLHQR